MKKRLLMMVMALTLSFSFAMGGCSAGNAPDTDIADEDEDDDEDDDRDDRDEPDEEPPMIVPEEISFGSGSDVIKFVKGDTWELTDKATGEVYGELEIDKNGDLEFTYLPTGATVSGSIVFTEPFDPVLTGINSYELTLNGLEEAFGSWADEDTSSGTFRIAQSVGMDYMYLEELGNGGSNIGYEVFRAPDTGDYDFEMNWVFTRPNDVNYIPDTAEDDVFYAFAYESDGDNVCLQKVEIETFEDFMEYTNYRYMGAYFDGRNNPGAAWYSIADDADLSGIFSDSMFSRKFPTAVYEVTVSDGEITSMTEQTRSAYGKYEFCPLDQKTEVYDDSFSINDCTFSLSDYGVISAAILDYEIFGDYLIMRCDINPHANEYVIFNMRSSWPEKKIEGCNFIHGDHIWDSYYSYMDTLYNYEGYPVATVDGEEICGLSFEGVNNNQIRITYWKDGDYDETYEETIDRPFSLNDPIYMYAAFRHHPCVDTWREFISYAPDDAKMMIMVNPPYDESWIYYQPETPGEFPGLDTVYVVALQDNTFINLGESSEGPILDKGALHCYSITVPEGGASMSIYAETDSGTSMWPVSMISGKEDIRYAFE